MLSDLNIESACLDDIDLVVKLYNDTIMVTEIEFDNNLSTDFINKTSLKDYFKDFIEDNNRFLLVARLDDKIVGFIDYFYALPKDAYINPVIKLGDIGVDINYRRQGIATKLYNTMIEKLSDLDSYQIRISFFQSNISASKFYEKLGYTEYSVTHYKNINN